MTDEKHADDEPEVENEQLKRPADEVEDLEPVPEDAEGVRGGSPREFYIK